MDKKEPATKNKLSLSHPGKLELKKTIEGGQVRQKFSHGRSKVVTVEVRKKRVFAPGTSGSMKEVKNAPTLKVEEKPKETVDKGGKEAVTPNLETGPTLTEQERATRASALEEARRQEERRMLEVQKGRAKEERLTQKNRS